MKRTLAILLALCLAFTLAACSADNDPAATESAGTSSPAAENTESAAESTESAAESTEPVSEPVSSEEDRTPISPGVPYVDGDEFYEFDCSKDLDEKGYYAGFEPANYVKLPESLNVTVPYDVHTVSDEAVDKEINDSILSSFGAPEQIMNRAVADGDTINIDYVGKLDGVAFEGGNTQGYGTTVTVGVTNYVDDFLQKLIGHKPGETFDIDIHFPADYQNTDLADKDTVFTVTINYIEGETIYPELTDAFVEEKLSADYGWKTVEEMRTGIAKDLSDGAVKDYIYDYLVNNSTVEEVPQAIIDYMTNYFIYYHSYVAKGYEVNLPILIANYGFKSMTDMLADYKQDIEDASKEELIMQTAAKKLGVDLTKEDLEAYFMEELGRTDYSIYETNFGLPYVKKMVLSWKVVNLLKEQATFLEK